MIHDLGRRNTGGMAGRTVVIVYAQVVESDTRKGRVIEGVMTRRAVQDCRQVIQGLAKGNVTIMALRAIAGIDTRVIEYHTGEPTHSLQ